MRCPSCGMDSKSENSCEWCRKPMSVQPALPPGSQPGIVPGTVRKSRTALTGEVEFYDEPITVPKYSPVPMHSSAAVSDTTVQMDSLQPQPTIQMNAQPTQAMMRSTENALGSKEENPLVVRRLLGDITLAERWEKFLALAFPVMALSLLIVHFAPHSYILITCVDLFVLGMFLGVFRAVPTFDDDYTDVSVVLIVCVMFGPVLALVGYGILSLIRQEANAAIFALFVLYYFVSISIGFAFQSSVNSLALVVSFGMFNLLGFLVIFVSFAGWLCSSFFIPLDE